MADLPFWQQLVLSGAQGLVAAGVVVVAGVWYFGAQERIRQEEGTRGVLVRLRQDAIVEVVTALGNLVDAKTFEAMVDLIHDGSAPESRAAEQRVDEAWREATRVLLARQLLLPRDLRVVLREAIAKVYSAGSDTSLETILEELDEEIAPLLPELPRHSR